MKKIFDKEVFMGICRICKYHTTPNQIKDYNEWLKDLIKKKIEQDKKKTEEETENNEDLSNKDTASNESVSNNESQDTENLPNENNDDSITTYELEDADNGINSSEDSENNKNNSNNESSDEDSKKEEVIEIPEDACFKFILPPPRPIPFTPLRLRKEKFLPPPITRLDMMHLCSHPEHVRKDHIKGDEWLSCCAIFNRFEECLLFEEIEQKDRGEDVNPRSEFSEDEVNS